MRHSANCRLGAVLTSGLAVLLLGGCIMNTDLVGGVTAESLTLETGVYWVEWSAGELVLYRMPEYRGDPEEWIVAEGDPPAWYVEPALYTLREDGTWQQYSFGDGQTLDEWLQLWDAAPPATEGNESQER